jgi:hypothetical protein
MKSMLRALVISQNTDALQRIREAFLGNPEVELSLYANWPVPAHQGAVHNVLILYSDAPSDWLRQLRLQGYTQPALILTADTQNPTIAPLEDDLCPLENVTWDVMRAGGLLPCVDMMLNARYMD